MGGFAAIAQDLPSVKALNDGTRGATSDGSGASAYHGAGSAGKCGACGARYAKKGGPPGAAAAAAAVASQGIVLLPRKLMR